MRKERMRGSDELFKMIVRHEQQCRLHTDKALKIETEMSAKERNKHTLR